MKRMLIILGVVLMFFSLRAQSTSNYYYANGVPQYWTEDSTSVNIIVQNMHNYNAIVQNLELLFTDVNDEILADDEDDNIIVNSLSLPLMHKDSIIAAIRIAADDIAFFTYSKLVNGSRIWLRNDIYVKSKVNFKGASLSSLFPVIQNYNVISIIEEEEDYRIICATEYDVVSLANLMHDTTIVTYSTPDFYSDGKLGTTDPYFGLQYGLKNTGLGGGTVGIDIKAEQAWAFLQSINKTFGESIKISVIDDGVEEHEDLYSGGISKVLTGWTVNGSGTGRPRPNGFHGQGCAGLISATHDTIGIAGIAPNTRIVPIRIFKNNDKMFSNARVAKGITKAWKDLGAKILSNSWYKSPDNEIIEKAIKEAVKNEVLVVACTGNQGVVHFPANMSEVIAVGSINRSGNVWGYSGKGSALDIVAPSGDINFLGDVTTTDRMGSNGHDVGNYCFHFGGTSAACPLVAGVAALVWSAKPTLTRQQVRNIIESTTQKIGNYPSTKPNGTWSSEMGYGLVDAHKAVVEAFLYGHGNISIYGASNLSFCNTYTYTCNIYRPDLFTYEWECVNNGGITILAITSDPNQLSVNITPVNAGQGTIIVKIYNQGRLMYTRQQIVTVNSTGLPYPLFPIAPTPLTITSNTNWSSSNRLLISPVTVQSGVTLTITSNVYCTENAKITVHPGGKLIIDGGTLTNACSGKMWQGITVMGNPSLPVNQTNQGFVQITNNGKIENAICGITVNGGGMVEATGAQFINNKTGVNFMPLYVANKGTPGTFSNTSFVLNNSYIGSIANFEGHLKMDNCGDVLVNGGCIFNNQSSTNIDNGIIVTDATTKWSGNNQLLSTPIDIKTGATFTHTGTISCNGTAKIIVHPGGMLNINGGTLTSGCTGQAWQGITVHNGGSVTVAHAQIDDAPVVVQAGGTCTVLNNGSLQLVENGKLIIEEDGNLVMGNKAKIIGVNNNVADVIHVKGGGFTAGTNATFENLTGGILLENSQNTTDPLFYDRLIEYDLNYTTFNNTPLVHRGTKLHIANCNFNQGSHVVTSISNSVIDKCYFSNSTFSSDHSSLTMGYDGLIPVRATVSNSYFVGNNSQTALSINNAITFTLEKNTIRSYEIGISLTRSGRTLSEKERGGDEALLINKGTLIAGNKVTFCGTGIELYASIAKFNGNSISGGNGFGVRLYNNSYTSFGVSAVQYLSANQYIIKCNSYEFYASANSFPTFFRYNSIYNEDKSGNFKNAPYFWWDVTTPYTGAAKDLNYNCWGTHFNPTIHLHPTEAFITDSIWCPIPPIKPLVDEEILYLTGLGFFADEDYTNAEATFKEIIETYPNSSFAIAALHELFALEHYTNNDFYSLNNYFASFMPADSNLFHTADFLATRCHVVEREWQPAIDWYENRIENPPSYQDSIFAVIDLGNIHLMMEEDTMGGTRGKPACYYRLAEIKPKSRQEYETNKTTLLATLPQIKKSEKPQTEEPPTAIRTLSQPDKKGALGECVPNPTNGNALIFYEIYREGVVEIQIYNIMGQLVKTFPQGMLKQGNYKVKISFAGVPAGLYHYSLLVNGERVDVKKVVVN